ncbi:OLC1v1036917C1 [Oldenlandia corymbosa var. corymbosa]|uniref:Receptor-like serine/threonine-protein kinase n=1 Tax=Oldenlandia corymbosa var. corymbosa TaxID=529605 RepID=A0AAV1CZN3_OLDCO|nr:OLC1v1036917C1 [Oldenlandia corymbosa var. corymbosa]
MLGQGLRIAYASFFTCVYLGFIVHPNYGSEIPLGSEISVYQSNYWVSSNGNFALGFFKTLDQYRIGIRFASKSIPIDKQTVVWVAGADLTVGNKSYFRLDRRGNLILYDSESEVIAWSSKTSKASVVSAILQDDGNFVLLNNERIVVWQSFDIPSDTLLPGQNFSVSHVLRPPRQKSLSSYYSLYLDTSGQLQLRWETSVIYWRSGNRSRSASRAQLNNNGVLQLLDKESESIWSISGEDHKDSNIIFRFLRLDADGNLRLYSWQNASSSWKAVWQAVNDQCDVFATCDLRGICILNETGSSICTCPFRQVSGTNSKCLVLDEKCESGFDLLPYEHTNLYGIYPPNETVIHTNLEECQKLCLEDPVCTAATFINNGSAQCRLMKTNYISGKYEPSLDSVSFVRTCADPIAAKPDLPPVSARKSEPKMPQKLCIPCIIGVFSGTVGVVVVIQLALGIYLLRRKYIGSKAADCGYVDPNARGCVMLSYSEISELTDNFKHRLGPKVFRGVLRDNQLVAVKELSTSMEERKFRRSVSKISSIFHKNLIKLDGYCCDSGHRLLVYEFAKNGSLWNCVEDPKLCKRLTWRKRIDICLAVARAISYLHNGCREFISHGNLKCENVLLDENLEPKVSEYGLHVFHSEMPDTEKTAETDVLDFGKMVVKLITGCQNADDACEWAYRKWITEQSVSLVDTRLQGTVNSEELERALRIAFWCLQVDERMRPSMGEVVKVLEGTLDIDPPPPLPYHNHMTPSRPESHGQP